jgi:hypothetical protein
LVVRVDFGRGYYLGGVRYAALIGTIFTTKQASLSSSIVKVAGSDEAAPSNRAMRY